MDQTTHSPLRTAVVGLGRIGFGFHCPAIVQHPNFELVGVVDPLSERRAEAAGKWNTVAFESLDGLLAQTPIDLVVIASPTALHVEHAQIAYAHRAHVLCDKPVTGSVPEFDRMIAAAQAAGRRFIAYQPSRHAPEVQTLKSILRDGLLGPVHLIRRTRSGYERRKDWQAFRVHGGGMLNNYGSHCLDELLWLLEDEPIRSVYCQTRRIASAGDADDVVKAILAGARGTLIDLEISQASALVGPAWEVFGAHGAARWDVTAQVWQIRRFSPDAVPPLTPQIGLAAEGRLYRTEELPWQDFTRPAAAAGVFDYYESVWRHLLQGAPPPVTIDETRRLLELISRCRASAETNAVT